MGLAQSTFRAFLSPLKAHRSLLTHMPNNSLSHPRRPGGQYGNMNALKHGFYTRRINKRDISGVEDTNIKGLAEEIALIRIFTRRLVESCDPSADIYELAGILRTICLATSAITRIIKAQAFLVNDPNDFFRDVDEAIRQVRVEMGIDPPPPSTDVSAPQP